MNIQHNYDNIKEQFLLRGVWSILGELEQIYTLKAILSAGVISFSEMELDIREAHIADAIKKSMNNPEIKFLKTLNEAVDALGDIKDITEQQKNAYQLCVETRDELISDGIEK